MLRSALKCLKYATVFFEEEGAYGVVTTTSIFDGQADPDKVSCCGGTVNTQVYEPGLLSLVVRRLYYISFEKMSISKI